MESISKVSEEIHSYNKGTCISLINYLFSQASKQPDKTAYTFLIEGEKEGDAFTFSELKQKALSIAAHLQSLHLEGERVVLLYPPGLDYVAAFFGCLSAGVIAVPAYAPKMNKSFRRIESILKDSEAKAVLMTSVLHEFVEKKFAEHKTLKNLLHIISDEINPAFSEKWKEVNIDGDAIAFLQYTSGSTGTPKGVMITHNNILTNLKDLDLGWKHTQESVLVTWLPFFHDMGLIYGMLFPIYKGISCYIMAPVSFLEKPVRWLKAISKYQGTHTAAPNFAYEFCLTKTNSVDLAGLDLSKWQVAVNGAEPVRAKVIEKFNKEFAPYGLSPTTICPGYGLAETTLKVASVRANMGFIITKLDADALEKNKVRESGQNASESKSIVGCGSTEIDTRVAIVRPETYCLCMEDEIGEIWVSGSTVAKGYWNKPEETEKTFHAYLADTGEGPFLRTGDLGFLLNEQLYVTGRLKDLIIIRGANYYPQDIEYTVGESHECLAKGSGAAFSIEVNGREELVIVQEVKRIGINDLNVEEVCSQIRFSVAEQHEIDPYAILLLRTATIPKTSSGKIQRQICKKAFIESDLYVVGEWYKPAIDLSGEEANEEDKGVFLLGLKELSLEEREKKLCIYLKNLLGRLLQFELSNIDLERSLNKLGLDSLMLVELKSNVQSKLGLEVKIEKFMGEASVILLSKEFAEMISNSQVNAMEEEQEEDVKDFTYLKDITAEMAQQLINDFDNYSPMEQEQILKVLALEN